MTQVNFDALNKIATMEKTLNIMYKLVSENREKRWLSTAEVAIYTGYSEDAIRSMVKNGEFIFDIHYYKPAKKLMFDKNEIDRWIMGMPSETQQADAERILSEFQTEIDLLSHS